MSSYASVSVLEDTSSNPPFEGPEKLLEVWFAPSPESLDDVRGLRTVKRAVWEDMLDLVRCKVLSVIQGDEVDAYLLSESSMFVWPHKLILKTCGTTTLLLGVDRLLSIAKEACGFRDIWRCFYSRKAFMFPERQIGPHKNWDDEVKFLDNAFGAGNGSAYVVGKMNGDHWLLYLTNPKDESTFDPSHTASSAISAAQDDNTLIEAILTAPDDASSTQASTSASTSALPSSSTSQHLAKPPSPPDQTLEILMTHLDPKACQAFFYPPDQLNNLINTDGSVDAESSQQGHLAGSELSRKLGIDTLLEGSTLDSFLFTPCGYSANIVKDDRYATIHVTPEEDWSYASFECNIDFRSPARQGHANGQGQDQGESAKLHDLIARVLGIFQPAKMSITLFVSVEETAAGVEQAFTPETRTILDPKVAEGYTRTDRILYEFAGYHLLFSTFEKRQK